MRVFKAIVLLIFFIFSDLSARGVEAGTIIVNQATLTYEQEEETFEILSNETRDIVDQIIDVGLHWLDEKLVVKNGAKGVICTFKLTNYGNGEDSFLLNARNSVDTQVKLLNKQIYIDTNQNAKWDGSDIVSTDTTLAPDESVIVYIYADIPMVDSRTQQFAKVDLEARSQRGGSGTPGYVHTGNGVLGLDAVDGLSGGVVAQEAQMIITDLLKPTIVKTIAVENNYGTNEPITYATLYVLLEVYLPQGGKVDDFKLTDVMPTNTSLINNSIRLNGTSLSDAVDNDAAHFHCENRTIVLHLTHFAYPEVLQFSYQVMVK